jgi:hypothetical protein
MRAGRAIVVLILMLVPGMPAYAGVLESLMMPGEVIEGHAKYEHDCNKCHTTFSKKQQAVQCRACHKKVDKDIRMGTGYHGLVKNIGTSECKICHTDHIGRKANIIKMDPQTFDHRLTDFPLHGSHRQIVCAACHKPDVKYRDTRSQCIDCHKKDDIHKGKLGKQCDNCHGERSWKSSQFDHNKTKFKLRGAHKDAQCGSCHPNERYKDTPMACNQCHALKDVHRGTLGDRCEKCHGTERWDRTMFRHDRDTKFPLRESHSRVACLACHQKNPYKIPTPKDCYSCHKKDDVHHDRFGTKCNTCHTESGWSTVRFDHDRDTRFSLLGNHKQARCNDCHTRNAYQQKTATDCFSCHKADDVHKGQQGKNCAQCHNESGWKKKVTFDHGLTRFPLIGLHALSPCESCHIDTAYKNTDMECYACHAPDDIHKLRFGKKCETCHNPNGWRFWHFDHNTDTQYKLRGKHSDLECHACHTINSIKAGLLTNCHSCHAKDDVHEGNFGMQCERCHEEESFRDVKLMH